MKRLLLLTALACSQFAALAAYIPRGGGGPPDSTNTPKPDGETVLAETGSPYHLKLAVDIPVTAVATAFTIYSFPRIYSKPESDVAKIAALDKKNLWVVDRWAAGKHSEEADRISNIPFYGSIPYAFLLLFDRPIRQDGLKVYFMYLEAMSVTGLLYTGSNSLFNRYRPETYRTDIRPDQKLNGNYKNAFFAGHVAMVATSTFFAATVYDDYHPGSSFKWVLYGVATAATGATIYLRHIAGKHFPTDLLVGTIIGVGSGMLVPRLHRNKTLFGHSYNLSPSIGNGYGLSFVYHL